MRRSPGFVAASVVIAALGIGATTAAFALVDHVLIRPLNYPAPDRLVRGRWCADIGASHAALERAASAWLDRLEREAS